MAQIYRGDLRPKQRRFVERYSPTSGYVREVEWRGFDVKSIQKMARDYAGLGCEYELHVSNDIGTLVAVDHTGEITIDTWEIGLNKLSPSILEHPTILEILENSGDIETVTKGIKQALEGTDAYEDIDDLDPVDSADEATLYKFLNMARIGQNVYHKSAYVLRHTTNVSSRYQANVSDSNVDCIYTTSQLLTEAMDASLWIYPLPGRLEYKLEEIPVPEVREDYLWGWLKSASPESTAANGRVNIVTEYELAQWSTLLYDTV